MAKVNVIGPDWPSLRALREALSVVDVREARTVSWGVERAGALNGGPRLNAIAQLTKMKEGGVVVPDFTTSLPTAQRWVKDGELVFGRDLHHTRGKDIVGPGAGAPLRWGRKWLEKEWWSKVVRDVKEEWRIHIFNGKSIARGLKVHTGESWRVLPVRNRGNGWTMVHNVPPPDAVREMARDAVKACGYDFGAVDLLLREGGGVVVLEVNTAPGLDDYTRTAYTNAIVKWANSQTR